EPSPGMVVILTASLSPPAMPAAPGAFDFRRIAWFQQVGALGYTRSPALMLEPPAGVWLARLRHDLARGIHAHLPGDAGGFAAAILAGDESGLSERALGEMRASNLVHILSISGLHMVLLCGAVFWA